MNLSLEFAELNKLQLRVARRADELARRGRGRQVNERVLWLRAEFEVFELAEQTWLPSRQISGGYQEICDERVKSLWLRDLELND
jgi:hypothetical protein